MSRKIEVLQTVTPGSVTAKYTGLSLAQSVSGSQVTLTTANIGGDSGALLTLGQTYRLAVNGTNYRDCLLWDIASTTHVFKVLSTVGAPGSSALTSISLVTDSSSSVVIPGVASIDSLILKRVNVTDQNFTITDETVVYATTTSTNQFDITFPTITAANHGRIIVVKVDVASGDVDLVPATGQQIQAGGASTKSTKDADATFIYQADFWAATAPNWDLVITA